MYAEFPSRMPESIQLNAK